MFTKEQITRFRTDTPGCLQRIHLNNAGAALMPLPVSEAITNHIHLESEIGGYEAHAAKAENIQGFYKAVAKLINAQPHQVAYMTSATDAYSRALSSIDFKRGDVLLTTRNDYVSNQIAFIQLQKRFGVKIVRAADNADGEVDVGSVAKLMDVHRPKVVAVTHVPMNAGVVQPVEDIGRLCREKEIIYLVDGCQSAGQLAVDVASIQCDFFSVTMRKFLRGPRGAGFLYVSDRILESGLAPIFVDLHSANWIEANEYELTRSAQRFELWERSYALVEASRAAVEYALWAGPDNIEGRVKYLAGYLRDRLNALPGISIMDGGKIKSGIVGIHLANWEASAFKAALTKKNINSSLILYNSALLDLRAKGVDWLSRLSPHYYNTIEEIDTAVSVIEETLQL